eukprot:4535329-Amphidinium_carterae.2
MHDQVVVRDEGPYAEMALIGRHHYVILQPAGQNVPTDVKGPPTFDAWGVLLFSCVTSTSPLAQLPHC